MSLIFPKPKDPDALLNYEVNWSQWLGTGETIADADVSVSSGITLNPDGKTTSFANGRVNFWISGGMAGEVYEVKCRVTTSTGQEDERTVKLPVLPR